MSFFNREQPEESQITKSAKHGLQSFAWIGTGLIVVAYLLVSYEVISPTDTIFHIMNGLGALGIVLVSLWKRAYQPAVLHIIWLVIAVSALVRVFSS